MRESRLLALIGLVFVSAAIGQPAAQSSTDDTSAVHEAAEQGDAKSQFTLGAYYASGIGGVKRDDAESAKWFRKAAEQGNALAQYNLASDYASGRGVPQDFSEAVRWYREAAKQGNVSAATELGEMYSHGTGVPQDYVEAVRWYREAAEKGDLAAQMDLGMMYFWGRGVARDYIEAHMWVNLFASQMSGPFLPADAQREAAAIRDLVASKMTAEQIAEAQRRAREWKPTKAK